MALIDESFAAHTIDVSAVPANAEMKQEAGVLLTFGAGKTEVEGVPLLRKRVFLAAEVAEQVFDAALKEARDLLGKGIQVASVGDLPAVARAHAAAEAVRGNGHRPH